MAGSEPVDKGSNPFPEANIPFSGRSADGKTGLSWEQVFAGSNPAALTIYAEVAQMARAPVL